MNRNSTSVQPNSPVALGFRVHSDWTSLVALSLDEDGPRVLVRRRPKLVRTFTYEFRQPYHTAERIALDKARAFVSRVQKEARQLALKEIHAVQLDLRERGHEVACFAVIHASARPLPSLDKILASHAMIHTADGELFRDALTYASTQCHLTESSIKESELVESACARLGFESEDLLDRLKALGKSVGSPWSQDEKFAALAAWLALGSTGASKS